MPSRTLGLLAALALICGAGLHAQVPTYPFRDYSMARDAELALVRTTCLAMRAWSAPTYTPNQFRDFSYDATIRAPICFDPIAARTVLPYYELRSTLGMAGKTPVQIADAVASAYATGALPKREGVSFAYMWSAEQHLGQGIGHWRPHMMVFAPYYTNAMVGGNAFGSPLPQLSDDAGTPFAVVVIPVDPALAVGVNGGKP